MIVSDLAINSSLLVAALDLNLVKLIRQAIRTADLTSAAAAGSAHPIVGSSPRQAAVRSVTETKIVKSSDRPAATFEPCRVHHWHPRLNELQPYTCTRPVQAAASVSSIQPPWKVLPWPTVAKPTRPPGSRTIKVQPNRADESSVGRTLDLFI
jgi:hypothetical protein